MSPPRTAFVTGGTGFIGSHLVEHLLNEGYREVRCLVRRDLKWLDGTDIVPIYGDLQTPDALRAGCEGVDIVYHLAGITRAPTWEPFQRINVDATRRLLDLLADGTHAVRRVVITSSLAVVGSGTDGVADESTPLKPVSRYGRSKAEMEQAAWEYRDRLPITVIRPPAVYGPRDSDIHTFFKTLTYGICPIVGDPTRPQMSLVHVRDLVRGIVQAAHAEQTAGETYFLGSEQPYSWLEIKRAACDALGQRALLLRVPVSLAGPIGRTAELAGRLTNRYPPFNRDKARELRFACKMCTVTKAKQAFGYAQQTPLADGIAETIQWYRERNWL